MIDLGSGLDGDYFRAFQDSGAVRTTSWRGVPMIKSPIDVYLFTEAIHLTAPVFVVETGTWHGGSAAMFADLGAHRVITIDPDPRSEIEAGRIVQVPADSTDPRTVERVTRLVAGNRTMVVLDSDHSYEHVRRELRLYAELVTPGCYLVIEDTSHTAAGEAAREFAEAWPSEWIEDEAMARFGATFNTWLVRR